MRLAVALVLFLAACPNFDDLELTFRCDEASPCDAGFVCVDNVCVSGASTGGDGGGGSGGDGGDDGGDGGGGTGGDSAVCEEADWASCYAADNQSRCHDTEGFVECLRECDSLSTRCLDAGIDCTYLADGAVDLDVLLFDPVQVGNCFPDEACNEEACTVRIGYRLFNGATLPADVTELEGRLWFMPSHAAPALLPAFDVSRNAREITASFCGTSGTSWVAAFLESATASDSYAPGVCFDVSP